MLEGVLVAWLLLLISGAEGEAIEIQPGVHSTKESMPLKVSTA